ncbi:phosphodiesterase [Konateibacter massiliensis]|uniref:phosphodiesterase n=1 Tax=Konateibacter massiliensis TaxID=2002841 RepID=UPI000C1564EA|nr:phosphodiesterase [Konateibacter massiliensis]
MKLMFASDIHGSAYYCEKMLQAYKEEGADKLILLGDLLYHGPRNDLPREYEPKKVLALLNSIKEEICAVRGNCDAEVDQMVLEFPIMADYAIIYYEGRMIYASHGHIHGYDNLPPLKDGDIFIQGHTHVFMAKEENNKILLNPGSISLPKENNEPTYGIIEQSEFLIKNFEKNVIKKITLKERNGEI